MNIHAPEIDREPNRSEAKDALRLLRRWVRHATDEEVTDLDPMIARLLPQGDMGEPDSYPALSRSYPADFVIDDTYKASLPDLQNGPSSLIRGANQPIQHVGISNFRLPIRYKTRDADTLQLETSVTGTVSLEADKKGINMSRIMRSFYRYADAAFGFDIIETVLDAYKTDLESFDARIMMRLSFPMKVPSLRSGLEGYQYYDIALEVIDKDGLRQRILHLDYVYSSTCPCSLELSEHARMTRGQLATPHSQRSVARVSVVLDPNSAPLWFEDMVELCRDAIPTETQVMVKREDEQAFAELNAANPIFVEDAARSLCEKLQADPRIGDFRIMASHQESLHSHDAVSVLTQGKTFDTASIDPRQFASLVHAG